MVTWPAVALLVTAGAFALGQNTKIAVLKKPASIVNVVEEVRKLTKTIGERNELLMAKTVQDLIWEVNAAKDKIIEAFKDELRNSNKGEHDDGAKGDEEPDIKCGNVTLKKNSTRLEPSGEKQNASFFLFETNSSWSSASASCENGGTELATLKIDLADMVAALKKIRPKWSKVWTSGKFDKDKSTWQWGSGDVVDVDLPLNATDSCLALSVKGSLEVFDCASILPAYICEADCA